jgi:hypothetical protein
MTSTFISIHYPNGGYMYDSLFPSKERTSSLATRLKTRAQEQPQLNYSNRCKFEKGTMRTTSIPVAEKKDQRVVRPRRKDSGQEEHSPDTKDPNRASLNTE